MKTCPNCGSILADNEPYCDNCGFDPDFDMGSWNRGSVRSSRSLNSSPRSSGLNEDIKEFVLNVIGVIIFLSVVALIFWAIVHIRL